LTHPLSSAIVRKAKVWYQSVDALLVGFTLFDKEEKVVFSTKHVEKTKEPFYEVVLAENERIIGVKAKCWHGCAYYFDFQFVIGRPWSE
jgi:hypothetical protein